jgi:hypothetical protein
MKHNSIFTICSKNFLAQALTLKDSVKKYEQDVDFYIFLADKASAEISEVDVIELDESWIPMWRRMAFKYDVVEFNTSIKPFCFQKMFASGYDNVIYMDPDLYVTNKLGYLWKNLEQYSVILTPHITNIELADKGLLPETDFLFAGIYNLGFVAIRNNEIGLRIVKWWGHNLESSCFTSPNESLFTDQKWMNFIPSFFPNDTFISEHLGLNVSYWNLHERELLVKEDGYYIKNYSTEKEWPLLIFHFSGFKPTNDKMISAHQPYYNIDAFPSFIPIIKEYKELEEKNGYEKLSKLHYAFNEFENGQLITGFHRRLYRATEEEYSGENPFATDSGFYENLKASKLLVKDTNSAIDAYARNTSEGKSRSRKLRFFESMAKVIFKLVGVKRYFSLVQQLRTLSVFENHTFLMREMKSIDKDEFYSYRITQK